MAMNGLVFVKAVGGIQTAHCFVLNVLCLEGIIGSVIIDTTRIKGTIGTNGKKKHKKKGRILNILRKNSL